MADSKRWQLGLALSTLAAFAVLGGIWWGLGRSERATERDRTQRAAQQSALRLSDFVAARLVAVDSVRRMREAGLLDDERSFVRSTTILHRELDGYRAINWIEADGTIRWVSPEGTNRAARGRNVFEHPDAAPVARLAERERRPTATGPLDLFQGARGFATYWPVVVDAQLVGYVNGVFADGSCV